MITLESITPGLSLTGLDPTGIGTLFSQVDQAANFVFSVTYLSVGPHVLVVVAERSK